MNDELIKDIDTLIDFSRYYIYDSDKRYDEHVRNLFKLRKHIDEGNHNKYLKKNGGDKE